MDPAEPRADGPFERLLDGKYALADPAGHVTRWGTGAGALFGLSPEQVVGRSLFDAVLHGHDEAWRSLAAGEGGAGSAEIDCTVTRPDGQQVPCRVQLVPVRLEDGLEVSFFAGDLAADESREDKVAALRTRHGRVLAMVEQADARPLESGERLAGLIAIFHADAPAAPEVEEALERAQRLETELAELRADVADGGAPAAAAAAELRALAERALAAAEEAHGAAEQALRAGEEARGEAAAARAEADRALAESTEARREAAQSGAGAEQAGQAAAEAHSRSSGAHREAAEARAEAERAREEARQARADAQQAQREAAQARREAEQARRELRGAQHALPTHPRPTGFFSGDDVPAEPDRPRRPGFDDATAPMAKLGLDGSFMELNSGFRQLVGYSEEEFASARWPSSADREHLEEQRELLRALVAGEHEGARVATSYMHREGLLVQLEGTIQLVRDESGAPNHLLLTLEVPASSGGPARPMA